MNPIKLLDQSTINKIAAGEVIERPASIVKELVENSIDAKASAVTVEIKDGGIPYLRITDNGVGIGKEQIETAFLRHSTSKITSSGDLMLITSLGFRGEALASIASVSQVEMITKTSNSITGTRFVIEGGEVKSNVEIGCPEGTTIIMRNLFFNTPVRKKFLKSATGETSAISDLISKIALGHPEISFKYIVNNTVSLHTAGNGQIENSIFNVYDKDTLKNMLNIENSIDGINLIGYISKPKLCRGNRNFESYFLNGRYVKNKIIQSAIEDAYKTLLPLHKYPVTVIHINMTSNLLDVNVHPTKMEVRFEKEEEIYNFVYNTIYSKLISSKIIPEHTWNKPQKERKIKYDKTLPEPYEIKNKAKEEFVYKPPINSKNNEVKETVNQKEKNEPLEQIKTVEEITNQIKKVEIQDQKEISEPLEQIKAVEETTKQIKKVELQEQKENIKEDVKKVIKNELEQTVTQMDLGSKISEELSSYKVIGQLFNTYWIIERENKMFIMDQHAAHERVMYEKIINDMNKDTVNSQVLLTPYTFGVSAKEDQIIKKNISLFIKIGFDLECFGDNTYIMRALPIIFEKPLDSTIFLHIVDNLELNNRYDTKELLIEKIASMACKAAVKGNDKLTQLEIENLIKQLMNLSNPYTCPHGRPTIISMTKYEIERKFKRA